MNKKSQESFSLLYKEIRTNIPAKAALADLVWELEHSAEPMERFLEWVRTSDNMGLNLDTLRSAIVKYGNR